MVVFDIDEKENLARMERGEMYYAFTPQLIAVRKRCERAVNKFNKGEELTRRQIAEHWKEITNSDQPLPPPAPSEDEEDEVLHEYPWITPPIKFDYGYNVKVGSGVFINANCTFIDTCPIYLGSRTILGPYVSFYSGTHPVDPVLRNGLKGPEMGAPINVGEDCWIGGNATILCGVTIGEGSTVGAGSVVTKDVPPFHVVAGNPARILRKIDRKPETEQEKKARTGSS